MLVVGRPAVGYLTLHPSFETTKGVRCARMGDLYVAPGHRRQGLARALVAAAAAEVRAAGGSFIEWTALPGNAGGLAFYNAIGAEAETLSVLSLEGAAFEALADSA
nr:GNAT family N-acetyltransferase [Roseococcus suduntuyensis]